MKKAVAIICCLAFIWMQATVLFGVGPHAQEQVCQCAPEATPCCPPASPAPAPIAKQVPVVRVAPQEIQKPYHVETFTSPLSVAAILPIPTVSTHPPSPPLYERYCSYLI